MKNTVIIVGAIIFLFFALSTALNNKKTIQTEGITEIRTVQANKQDKSYDLNILFIGNSYTFFNDIPGIILKIAENDSQNPHNILIQSITFGGARLQNHWNNTSTHKIIENHPWDMIVLQEQSQWALFSNTIKSTAAHVAQFTQKAKAQKSYVMLYQTWPRQPGSNWYTLPEYKDSTKNPEHMFKALKNYTAKIAYINKIATAPVGEYWYKTMYINPEIQLYNPDGSHPSMAGSYLAALVFYKNLTGNSPMNTSYIPKDIPKSQGETLKRITSDKL
ncbi:MAG: DUF4886 domain-containing protein [Alphaproteobacteria bacterium]